MRRLLRLTPLRLVLLATLALALLYQPLSRVPLVAELESKLLDLRFRMRADRPPPAEIVLVLIDDESIRRIGRWPWDRGELGQLVRAIGRRGPRAIGINLLFLEPASMDDARGGISPGDRVLAQAIGEARSVVIPFSFNLEGAPTTVVSESMPEFLDQSAIRIVHGTEDPFAPDARGVLAPIAALGRAAAGLGHTNIGIGPEGEARYEYPVIRLDEAFYPSFALELARLSMGVDRARVWVETGRGVRLGDLLIPTDDDARMVVNYRRHGFERLSAFEVMDGATGGLDLDDRVVLIGAAAAGLGATFETPFSPALSGTERDATVLGNILQRDFVIRRNVTDLGTLAEVVLGGLILGIVASRGLWLVSACAALLASVIVLIDLYAFQGYGLWLPLFLPLACLVLLFGTIVLHRQVIDGRQRRMLRDAFRHYLSPPLVERVVADPSLLRLGGEERELTVMFADIRNSTSLAARLAPDQFVQLLNDVFSVMSRVVFEHHGMLDKFTGDGLIAIFGAPLPRPDHAELASRSAVAVQAALAPVRERWARPDLPPVEVGIGINTGTMIIGNMGSSERLDYTVIGDEANLGARLETANKDFGTSILISEATWQRARHVIAAREVDTIRFRGMERHVRVYDVLGAEPLEPGDAAYLEAYERAVDAARRGRVEEARSRLEACLKDRPNDRVARLHLARLNEPGAHPHASAPRPDTRPEPGTP